MTPIASPSRTGDPGHRALPVRARVRERAQDPARRDPEIQLPGSITAHGRLKNLVARPHPRGRDPQQHSSERRSSWAAGCGRVAELHGREWPCATPRGGGDEGHGAHRARTRGRRRRAGLLGVGAEPDHRGSDRGGVPGRGRRARQPGRGDRRARPGRPRIGGAGRPGPSVGQAGDTVPARFEAREGGAYGRGSDALKLVRSGSHAGGGP